MACTRATAFDSSVTVGKRAYFLGDIAFSLTTDIPPSSQFVQVGLVEALHDHLKGSLPPAPANLGAVPEAQGGKGGVCADSEGVFLKTALLYLASKEVSVEVLMPAVRAKGFLYYSGG